ncbi:MAG: hypothetical protein V4650_12870 [Pseudomonadota bacterium]
MKTIVLQSFRRHDVPAWMNLCMDSVRAWAASRAYQYQFLDDAFFEPLPDWFLQSAGTAKTIWTDYARVLWARHFLAQGYERFIWVDADVLVFVPAALTVEQLSQGYGFCHEIQAARTKGASTGVELHHRINNAISVYCRGNPFLDFYRHAMERMVRKKAPLAHDSLGTVLLSHLGMVMPVPVLLNVGLFNPLTLQAVAADDASILGPFLSAAYGPLAAANVCQSLRGRRLMGVQVSDELVAAAIENCLRDGGGHLNRHRRQTSP